MEQFIGSQAGSLGETLYGAVQCDEFDLLVVSQFAELAGLDFQGPHLELAVGALVRGTQSVEPVVLGLIGSGVVLDDDADLVGATRMGALGGPVAHLGVAIGGERARGADCKQRGKHPEPRGRPEKRYPEGLSLGRRPDGAQASFGFVQK